MLRPAFLALAVCAAAAVDHPTPRVEVFGAGRAVETDQLPPSTLRRQLHALPQPAREHALRRLREVTFHRHDCDHLHVDPAGNPYYACQGPAIAEAATSAEAPVSAEAGVPVATSVPVRHSLPGATRVIYLDFNGATVTGTQWNTSLSRTTIEAVAYDTDGDVSTFSSGELAQIERIWQRVAEDYAPFQVDVTTEQPTTMTNTTAVVLITRNTDAGGNDNPSSGAGGVAYVNVFGTNNFASHRPAWVYVNNLSNRDDHVAEATSHEAGHNFGLSHDGTSSVSYYNGHGSGDVSWGPIMGSGFTRSLSQWSKGEYSGANNTQDDLAVISGKLPYRSDDHGDSIATAGTLTVSGTSVSGSGIISTTADVDVLRFTCGAGSVSLDIDPITVATHTRGSNLDVKAELLDASGTVLASHDPADRTYARITATVTAGTYYLRLDGVGTGSATGTGYSDYGSLGQWTVTGTVPAAAASPGSIAWTSATATIGEATSTVTLTARRSGGSSGAVGAAWATADATASAGSDYTAASGTLAWADGDSADKTVSVTIINDTVVESAETFTVALSAATGGASLGVIATTTVTITDNDTSAAAGTIAWTATTASVGEATSTVTLTARRSGGSSGAVGASWATANATATAGSDYTAASGTLAWGAGDTADKTVSITIANDAVVEGAETFTVTLSAATGGATLGTAATTTVTIVDDDSGLPSPWQSADVGAVAAAGSASESGGTWTVRGSGADIWGTADEFRFVWQELAGDGEVVARVTAIGTTHAWAKAGVMIRAGGAANAAHAMMIHTAGKGGAFQFRSATGGASRHVAGGAGPAPAWVKIARAGNVLTGSTSDDGVTWTMVGHATVAMGVTARVGLVVTSHLDGTLCTATFTGVGVTPTGVN